MENNEETGGRNLRSALNVRVGVKPVFAQLVHSAAWEGPCRVGDREELTPEAERAKGKKAFMEFQEELRVNLSSEAKLLEPVYIEYKEDFVVSEK